MEALKLGVDLLLWDARPHFKNSYEAPLHARMEFHRNVDIRVVPRKSHGKHAHDREELVVQPDLLSQHVAPAGEMALPKQITEHRWLGFRFITGILRRERAPKQRRDPEELEGVGGEVLLIHSFREANLRHHHASPRGENH